MKIYFENDPVLEKLIKILPAPVVQEKEEDVYLALIESIISQQLSIKVAQVILARFLSLFEGNYPHPESLSQLAVDDIRKAGLSYAKASYVLAICDFHMKNSLDFHALNAKTDEELITFLTQIKGVGRWTAEMILIFTLNRPDVFPVADLAIQNTMKKLYNVESEGKQLIKDLIAIAENWRPNRTLASRYIWLYKDQF